MKSLICIVCPNGCHLTVENIGDEWVVNGNLCPRGRSFAVTEMTNPTRTVCSTVKTTFKKAPRLPVRTDSEVPLSRIFDVMGLINGVVVNHPVRGGEVLIQNVCGTGANVIATSDTYNMLKDGE